MNEDKVIESTLKWLTAGGWLICYRTRSIAEGAIGGADAILCMRNPWRFIFVDGKGKPNGKEAKSNAFANCLGSLVKRIRITGGYSGNEMRSRFMPVADLNAEQVRDAIRQYGIHANSEYILALPTIFETTVTRTLDSKLARMLHIRVLMISEAGVEELTW
jgi:hypothetical protein